MISAQLLKPKLKDPGQIPWGGGYSLNLPEQGLVGSGSNLDSIIRSIKEYRKANALPIGLGLEEEIERELCKRWPQECFDADARVPSVARISFQRVIQATRVMLTHWWNGRQLVPDEEANRRAAICAQCPYNSAVILPCGNRCGELESLVVSVIGAKSTTNDASLRQCAVCGCFLQAAVWVDLDTQRAVLTDEQVAQFELAHQNYKCWKHKP